MSAAAAKAAQGVEAAQAPLPPLPPLMPQDLVPPLLREVPKTPERQRALTVLEEHPLIASLVKDHVYAHTQLMLLVTPPSVDELLPPPPLMAPAMSAGGQGLPDEHRMPGHMPLRAIASRPLVPEARRGRMMTSGSISAPEWVVTAPAQDSPELVTPLVEADATPEASMRT